MQTLNLLATTQPQSGKALLWTGRIISGIVILFMLVDAIMKIIMNPFYVEGTEKAGFSVNAVQPLGFVLLACTILYSIPRTAILGALFLTAYLGGAVATMVRLGEPFIFPIIMAILVWAGLYVRNERLRQVLPFARRKAA